jgi:sulfofructose kinase
VDTIYPEFDRVLRNVDYLVASSVWPRRWTGLADPFDALTELKREYGFRVAAMTLGQDGALAFADGEWTYSAGFDVDCVDTTGAGDVFHGAFCFAILQNMSQHMDLGAALEFSNAAAALNCTALGARGHIGSLGEVRALIASGGGRHISEAVSERVREWNAETATRQ